MSEAAEDEGDDSGALAAVGCLRAISTILESVSSLPHLFGQVEPTLMPIMTRMLTSDGQGTSIQYVYVCSLCPLQETTLICLSVCSGPARDCFFLLLLRYVILLEMMCFSPIVTWLDRLLGVE
jgi:hypothetical protein